MKQERFEISVNQEDVQNIINCYEKDIKYIEQLEDNWNKLKECIKSEIERTENLIKEDCNMIQINNIREMLNEDRECWLFKMQEIEKGGMNE